MVDIPPPANDEQGRDRRPRGSNWPGSAGLRINALKPLARPVRPRWDLLARSARPTGLRRVIVPGLALGWEDNSPTASAALSASPTGHPHRRLSGQVAGGTIRLRPVSMTSPSRSGVGDHDRAQRVDARTLLAPFTESPPLDGPLDARLYTRIRP